jgi:hypothetical protein
MGKDIKWSCAGLREDGTLGRNAHDARVIGPAAGTSVQFAKPLHVPARALTVIFATERPQAESDPASEYSHPGIENRDLDDLEGPAISGETIRGFRKAVAAEVLLRWAMNPYPAAATRRPKTATNAQPGREALSHCHEKNPGSDFTLDGNGHLRDDGIPEAISHDELHDDWRR